MDNRPYRLQQNDTGKKFSSVNNQLTSPYLPGTSSTLITRFPTDEFDHKFSNVSNKYSFSGAAGMHNNTNALAKSSYNTYSDRNKSGLGLRTPLYNSTRKNSNTPSVNEYRYVPSRSATTDYNKQHIEDYNNYNQQKQQPRQIPVQIKEEAKKSKSTLKSIRSFFKKHLIGRRDYSTPTPVSKRFASALEINGSLPPSYATPIAHRRSTSTSSQAGLPRPQSTFSLSRATGRTYKPTITSYDKIYNNKNMTPSVNSSIEDLNEKMANINNYSMTNGLPYKSKETVTKQFQPNLSGSIPLASFNNNFANSTPRHTKQLSQPRPSTSDAIQSIEANSLPAKKVVEKIFQTTNIPCLKGLTNHGNTCYFSAIMQCLACCDRFAEHFVCSKTDESEKNPESLSKALANTLRCLWFNNHLADSSCLKTLQLIGKEKPQFVISHQQDSHECLIWLLDKLHEEIKEDEFRSKNKIMPSLQTHKSEGELAIDALERISGGKGSTIMDIFRGQFRSAIECTSPVCGFSNLTFDPYLTVSLSIPLPKRAREISVIFIPFFSARQIVRYHFNISERNLTVNDIKERILKTMIGSTEDAIACNILSNGQCQFLQNKAQIDDRIKEFILMEMPKLNEQQQLQDLVVAIVIFVVGIVPDGERYGLPFIAVLNRQWSYDRICKFLLDTGTFLLPRAFYPLPSDYTLLIQHSAETVACLDPMMSKPLFHECVNKVLEDNSNEKVLKLLVEWSSSIRHEFNRAPTESIANDYSFLRTQIEVAKEYVDQQIPIPLINLIEDYVKTETIQDWKCSKCGKSPGRKELKFHSLPDILIFHLNRFELLNNGITKKIDTRVQVPIDGLDLTPFVFNPDLRASTLPKHRKDRNTFDNLMNDGTMLYDLIGVVYHYGERTNSGHYTAATRNPADGQWRTFDDSRVSLPIETGGEIRMSTKSYLLFYERRKQGRTIANWFPQKVPEQIVAKFSKKATENNIEDDGKNPILRGSSQFYTGTLIDDGKIGNESEELMPFIRERERKIPITINRMDDDIRQMNTTTNNPYNYSLPRSSIRSASTTPYSTYLAGSNHQIYPNTRYTTHRF